MKKLKMIQFLFIFVLLFTGCGISSKSNQNQPLKVYSFSGENEFISVSNGVIVLEPNNEICHGGNLKVKSDEFTDISKYSTTLYLNNNDEKAILLSNVSADQTGGTLDVSGDLGQIAGDIIKDSDIDKLVGNLWLELETTDLTGYENTYQLPLDVIEITKTETAR